GVPRGEGGVARVRRPLPAGDRRRGAGRARRARPDDAHEGGVPRAALPDRRRDPVRSRRMSVRAHPSPDRPHLGPRRRHARDPRRQRLPERDRGGAPRGVGARRAVRDRRRLEAGAPGARGSLRTGRGRRCGARPRAGARPAGGAPAPAGRCRRRRAGLDSAAGDGEGAARLRADGGGGPASVRVEDARVARLATVGADGRPHVVPICFALAGSTLYTAVDAKPKRTRRLRRLANVESNQWVEVVVDDYDEDWSRLWWVRLAGRGRVVERDERALELLAAKYPSTGVNRRRARSSSSRSSAVSSGGPG